MKTDVDLFQELLRHILSGAGASPAEVEFKIHEFRTLFKTGPPKELSDEDYARQLEQMKKEAPAFLHYIMTNKFPDLPPGFSVPLS
jgi:hypothetical protein